MVVKLRMTYDDARTMARYLSICKPWPEWEFPGLEIEYYDPDPDVEDGGLQILFEE